MKNILLIITITLAGFLSSASATTIRFEINSWNLGYGPYDTVYINIRANDNGGRATLYFHRDRLPEILVEFDSRNNLPKVHYSIEEFENVMDLLKDHKIKEFYFDDYGSVYAGAILVQE